MQQQIIITPTRIKEKEFLANQVKQVNPLLVAEAEETLLGLTSQVELNQVEVGSKKGIVLL